MLDQTLPLGHSRNDHPFGLIVAGLVAVSLLSGGVVALISETVIHYDLERQLARTAMRIESSSRDDANETQKLQKADVAQLALLQSKLSKETMGAGTAQSQAQIAGLVNRASHGRLALIGSYTGPFGLTAVGLTVSGSQPPRQLVGWVLPNNQGLMIGALLDPSGRDYSAALFPLVAQAPPNVASQSNSGLELELASLHFSSLHEGNGPTKLTIFFDPNCSACHYLWAELHEIGNYRSLYAIDWVPVAFLKPSSSGRAAATLRMTGVTGLDEDERKFNISGEQGGLPSSADKRALSSVTEDTAKWQSLMLEHGQQLATPTIIVNGQQIIVGTPGLESLKALGGAALR